LVLQKPFLTISSDEEFDAHQAFTALGHGIPDSPLGQVSFQGAFTAPSMASIESLNAQLADQKLAHDTAMLAMQTQIAALIAGSAPPAPAIVDPTAIAAITTAVTSALALRPTSSTHVKDLDKSSSFSFEESPGIPVENWLKNIKSDFDIFGTPDDKKAALVIKKFTGKAAVHFEGFINASGAAGCRTSTTWTELENWILTGPLSQNRELESRKLQAEYSKLSQTGSSEAFAKAYSLLTARILTNLITTRLYTLDGMISNFIQKSKYHVQEHLDDKVFTTLEAVYAAAAKRDNLWFLSYQAKQNAQNKRPGAPSAAGSPFASRSASPALPFRSPTPLPPPQLHALLAAIYGLSPNDPQLSNLSLPSATFPGLAALGAETDHSVAEGMPIPKMTPDIEAWCRKHNACYRCRTKNATHRSNVCPRFKNAPDRTRTVAALGTPGDTPLAEPFHIQSESAFDIAEYRAWKLAQQQGNGQ
jgi:hypothetical protein